MVEIVKPKEEYPVGSIGSMAPSGLDPNDPQNNPFNPDKIYKFLEVEVDATKDTPRPKPTTIKKPGNLPTSVSLGIKAVKKFSQPEASRNVVNDLFPNAPEVAIVGEPRPRASAVDWDTSKNIDTLPKLTLHPIPEMLTAADGPGFKPLQLDAVKPSKPIPTDSKYKWHDPMSGEGNLSQKSVEWLTFRHFDAFFSDTGHQVYGSLLKEEDVSLRARLTDPRLQNENSVWKNTSESYLKEIVFTPDLPFTGSAGQLSWAEIVAYVNYFMVNQYFAPTQEIYVNGDKIVRDDDATDIEKIEGTKTVPTDYLQKLIAEKTSTLLYKDKISAIDLPNATIAYNVRKLLGSFFVKKAHDVSDSATIADELCYDLLKIGVSTALESLQSHKNDLISDSEIKEEILNRIDTYITSGAVSSSDISVTYGSGKTIYSVSSEIFDDFINKGYFEATDKENTLLAMRDGIRGLFLSLMGDLVLEESRKYKLHCQISQIDRYLNIESYDPDSNGVQLSQMDSKLTTDQFQTLQKALRYIKSQLVLLKNETHLPQELTVNDLIIDYKPVPESNSVFKNVTDYLNGSAFSINQYVNQRIREPIQKAVHKVLVSEMKDSKIRDVIKKIFPAGDNTVQGNREKLRYALSGNFLPDLEAYIVNRVLDATLQGTNNNDSAGDLITSLINERTADLPIQQWIDIGLNLFLSGGTDDITRKELEMKYAFVRSETMRAHANTIIREILSMEGDSPLVTAIEEQISEETLVLAMKDKVEAQLQSLQSIILGQKIATINGVQISATNNETERFLEYAHAKILKDHYESIIHNDLVKYIKLLGEWFGTTQVKSKEDVITLLIKKIEELRKGYGKYYDAIQSFPLRGEAYLFEDGTSYFHPKLDNQYDLFSTFFKPDQSDLNISKLLADYINVYEQYGIKCYRDYKKYDISDYSVELMNLLEKYADLKTRDQNLSNDIFAEAILKGIRSELIALKRELETIDLFLEYQKATTFKEKLNTFLLDEMIAGWRSDEVKLNVLITKIHSLAVDLGIMRTLGDGFGSGTVDTSVVSLSGEKEYNEDAEAYKYVQELVKYLDKYNIDQDINVPVAEILNAIKAYRTSDLSGKGELLSQFKRLLISHENIPYTDGTSLFEHLTKYISSSSIDFSLLTLFANIYSTIKKDDYVPTGITSLTNDVLTNAKQDIKDQMESVYQRVQALNNNIFGAFVNPASTDERYDVLASSLAGLTPATKTFEGGGGYAYIVNEFIAAYNTLCNGLKDLVDPQDQDWITALKDANDTTADTVFTNIQGKLNGVRGIINGIYTGISSASTGGVSNEASLKNAINDLLTILDYIEVAFFIEKEQKKYPKWYIDRGNDGAYGKVLGDLENFAGGDIKFAVILNNLIKFLRSSDASYSLVDALDTTLLPLKGVYNLSDVEGVPGILSNWKSDKEDSLRGLFNQASYDPIIKFGGYTEQFMALNTAMASLMDVYSSVGGIDVQYNIYQLSTIELLSSDYDADGLSSETSAEKNHYFYVFNQVASAYNAAVALLKGGAVNGYLGVFSETFVGQSSDVITAFKNIHGALAGLENTIKTTYMDNVQKDKEIYGDSSNKLTETIANFGQAALQWLLDVLQQSKKITLANLLHKIGPSNWAETFDDLEALKVQLKGFVEGGGIYADTSFSLTKADCLKLLDAIDAATHDTSSSPRSYSDFKNAMDTVTTSNPPLTDLVPQNGLYLADVQNLPRTLDLHALYTAIHTIAGTGEGPNETIDLIGEIAPRKDGSDVIIGNLDSTYDRSRWLIGQFVLAHNAIVENFWLNGANPSGGSFAEAVKTYETNLADLTEAETNQSDVIAKKTALRVTATNLHTRASGVLAVLEAAKTSIQELSQTDIDDALNWGSIGDISGKTNTRTIALNGQSFEIAKFNDSAAATIFYIVQSGSGANKIQTFLTASDAERLQSLITAETELYQSFNNQAILNVVDRLGDYSIDGYNVSAFLESHIIETTTKIFTAEFNDQSNQLVAKDNLSLLDMYRGVYSYGTNVKIDNASAVLQKLIDVTSFWQLATEQVFAGVDPEATITTKTVDNLDCSLGTIAIAKENYIKSLKTGIYDTLVQADAILTGLNTAIINKNETDKTDRMGELSELFGELLTKIGDATFSENALVTLDADTTGLPQDVNVDMEEERDDLETYSNQALANFRWQVVDRLKAAFETSGKHTKEQLEAFQTLLCGITNDADDAAVYLFSADNTANPYVFYGQNEDDLGEPGNKDLLIDLLNTRIGELQEQNEYIQDHPASSYFFQKTGFDYNSWLAGTSGEAETAGSITAKIGVFVGKFKDVTYNTGATPSSWGSGPLTSWEEFWGQTAGDSGGSLAENMGCQAEYSNAREAYQYLFLKALDEVKVGSFSSSNKTQLEDILKNFDKYCLGIDVNVGDELIDSTGFLLGSNGSNDAIETALQIALNPVSEISPDEAYYTWNDTEIKLELQKYPGSAAVIPLVDVTNIGVFQNTYDLQYVDTCWQHILDVCAYNIFASSVEGGAEAFKTALEALIADIRERGYNNADSGQQNLFAALKTGYGEISSISITTPVSLNSTDLDALDVDDAWIDIFVGPSGKWGSDSHTFSDEEKTAITNKANTLKDEQVLRMQEQARYDIVNALADYYNDSADDSRKILDLATIRSVLTDTAITGSDKIFGNNHNIFKLLDVFDNTSKIGGSGSGLKDVLGEVFENITHEDLKTILDTLKAIFKANDLNTALIALKDCKLDAAKTAVTNALSNNASTADDLQKAIIADRLENMQAILNGFESLKDYVVSCLDGDYGVYQTRMDGKEDILSEEVWKDTTIAGILFRMNSELFHDSLELSKLKQFSTELNNVLGKEIAENDITDPEVMEAMANILNCSKEIEKLLLLNVLQGKLCNTGESLDAAKKEMVQKFLYEEEALTAFQDDISMLLTLDKVLTLLIKSPNISSAALLGDSIRKVGDLNTTYNATSLAGIFEAVPGEIEYIYNLRDISNALGVIAPSSELLCALKGFADEMFNSSPVLTDTPILGLEFIENLAVDDISKNDENHSLSVLVEAYNDAVRFFHSDALIKADALTTVQADIVDFVDVYDEANPNDHALQKGVLQMRLAYANGLLTIFEDIFNDPSANTPAYREVLSMVHAQLRSKINEKIRTLMAEYSCIQIPAQGTYIGSQPIGWNGGQIGAHNAYMSHLIENLYRFEALTYLGIFPKFNGGDSGNNATRTDIAYLRSVFGHWEEWEESDEEIFGKYLFGGNKTSELKELLYKAYIAADGNSGKTLSEIFKDVYPQPVIKNVDLGNIEVGINSNINQNALETLPKIFDNYELAVTQCVQSIYNEFYKFAINGTTPKIENITEVSLDKLLHDLAVSAVPLSVVKAMKELTGTINGEINTFNEGLINFVAAPTQSKLDDLNGNFSTIIDAIEIKISETSVDKFESCLTEIKKVFEDAQPQYYLILLEKLYPNLATDASERSALKNKYDYTFSSSGSGSIADNINDKVATIFNSFGEDETLQKYCASNKIFTFNDTLLTNANKFRNNVNSNVNAVFQQLTELQSKFKALNMLLWNALKSSTTGTEIKDIWDSSKLTALEVPEALRISSEEEEEARDHGANVVYLAKGSYIKLIDVYNIILGKLTAPGADSLSETLQKLVNGDYKDAVNYEDTDVCKAIKATVNAIKGKLTTEDTVADMFRAFNTACLMIFFQRKYPVWNSDQEQLDKARAEYNAIFTTTKTYAAYYTCGSDDNVEILLGKIKPYQGDIKIIDSHPHYFEGKDGGAMTGHRVDISGWLYREPTEKGSYIQYDVQQNKQYVYSNGQYFELVEPDVAFIQISPEQHVRVLTPNILYEQSTKGYQLTTDKVTQPVSRDNLKSYFALGEDGQYYNINRYHLKYKVYDEDMVKYIDLNSNDSLYYKATMKGYAEVPTKDLPDLRGNPANGRDYFIVGDEEQYYKVGDVYAKYYYKKAELSADASEEEKNTVEGTYFEILSETNGEYSLDNGEKISNVYNDKIFERDNTGLVFEEDPSVAVVNGAYYLENALYHKINAVSTTLEKEELNAKITTGNQLEIGDEYILSTSGVPKKVTGPSSNRYKILGYDVTGFNASGRNVDEAVRINNKYYNLKSFKIVYKGDDSKLKPFGGNISSLVDKQLYVFQRDVDLDKLSKDVSLDEVIQKGQGESVGSFNKNNFIVCRCSVTPFYRSIQNEQKFFGMKLYQWEVSEKYVARDNPYLVVPVTYERYVGASETPDGFTADSKDMYIYSSVLKQYVPVGKTDEYYFEKPIEQGQGTKEYRIEFPDRRYAQNEDGEYLYIPHPESRYSESNPGGRVISGDCIYTSGQYLPIAKSGEFNIIKKFANKASDSDINPNNDYVQGSDGGYYKLSDVKIKATNGQEFSYTNEFKRVQQRSSAGTFVCGINGNYYEVVKDYEIYANYELSTDTDPCYILRDDSGVKLVEVDSVQLYAQYNASYYAIQTVTGDETDDVLADDLPLQKGDRYITVSGENKKILNGEKEYVKLAGENTYDTIKDVSGALKIKKKITNILDGIAGFSGMVIANTNNKIFVTNLEDPSLYNTGEATSLIVNNWQSYALEETTYNNLFVKDTTNKQLIRANENTGDSSDFVTPLKSTTGSYVRGEDGIYHDMSDDSGKLLYADYNLVSGTDNWFFLQGSSLISLMSDQKEKLYAQYLGAYYAIQTVGTTTPVKADTKTLFPGNRYITIESGTNVQIKEGEKEYVNIGQSVGSDQYVAIEDALGKIMVKKQVKASDGIAGLDGMLVARADQTVITTVKDKNLYGTKAIQVEGENGRLYDLNAVKVKSTDIEGGEGDALDKNGLSNIFVKNGTEFIRVSNPTDQYKIAENSSGNFIKIDSRYYDRRRDDITLKMEYKNEEGQECFRTLDGNDPNIPFYLNTDDDIRVKSFEVDGITKLGLFKQYSIAVGAPVIPPVPSKPKELFFWEQSDPAKLAKYNEDLAKYNTDLNAYNFAVEHRYEILRGSKPDKAVTSGGQYYNLEDFQLVVKRDGSLTEFTGTVAELLSSNGTYMIPYIVPAGVDLNTYDAKKAVKIDRYNKVGKTQAQIDELNGKYTSGNGYFEFYTVASSESATYAKADGT
ncbi:MAG: hypothetical protein LBR92_04635, partial [Puniceicoccales bacterium]|nr:hypothetical protein [Puniceicoccales bacterium]